MNFGKNLLFLVLLILFTVGSSFASDFYWVGNDGNWNDSSHWSSTSGGNGGIGIPTQNDDVFFDEFSFTQGTSITINGTAHCKNFNWTNNQKASLISSNTTDLFVNGSFYVNETYQNEFYGKTTFSSSHSNNTITSKGIDFLGNIEFNGSGEWILNDLFSVKGIVSLSKGNLKLNGQHLMCESFISNSNNKRNLSSTNSFIIVANLWDFSSTSKLNLNLGNSKIFLENNDPNNIKRGSLSYNIITPSAKMAGTLVVNSDSVTCNGLSDGNAIATMTGSLCAGFIYTWLAPINQVNTNGANDTIFNLPPGTYTVIVQDTCDGTFAGPTSVSIVEPAAIAILPAFTTITPPTCFGDCDGSISLLVNGGTETKIATWGNGDIGISTTTPLCAGTITLHIEDYHQCTLDSIFTVPETPIVSFNLAKTDLNCFSNCDGTATVSSESGGNNAPYNYAWTSYPGSQVGAAEQGTSALTNLCEGIYEVIVSDAQGCSFTDSVTITEPLLMTIDTSLISPTCGGDSDGSIIVTVTTGGTSPFTHSWSTGFSETINTGVSSVISTLSAGNYCDTIVDFNGCDTIICFTITEPDTLLTTTNITDITCKDDCNGTAVTSPTGGLPAPAGYNFVWDSIPTGGPFAGQGTDSISGLCPGTYFVTVSDINNCSSSDTISIVEPPLLVANPSSTDITCLGFDDGTATVNPTGGSGTLASFNFAWTSTSACFAAGANTQSISSLCPGTYFVTVTDSLGCTAIDSVTIDEPQVLSLILTDTPESCAGNCDGTAGVTVTGGTPGTTGYTFLWTSASPITSGQGTDSIFSLCPDNYTVLVTDSLGCSDNQLVTVLTATAILANLVTTDLSCNANCNGTATVSPSGTGPFTVVWTNDGTTQGPGTGPFAISSLCAGADTATIADGNGCILVVPFTINQPPPITSLTNTTDISCFSICDGTASTTASGGSGVLSYNWTPITGGAITVGQGTSSVDSLCSGTYFVTITDDSLCTLNDTIQIFEPFEIFPNATFTNVTCSGLNNGSAVSIATGGAPGFSYFWTGPIPFTSNDQSINPIGPGEYIVTVTDTNGCIAKDTVNIIDPTFFTVSADATAASCQTLCDGIALATPSGGTPSTSGSGYTYVWTITGPPSQTSQTAIDLCAGQYEVTVTDSLGCTATDTTVINPLITIQILPTPVQINCNGICDGAASASPSGGLAPYSFQWSGNNTVLTDTLSSIDSLCSGWVYVTVTDANGCISLDSAEILSAPAAINPNGQVVQEISCFGQCDAMVTHSPTGGTAPYTSVWTLPFGIDTNNVCPTFVVITITDSNNCIASDTLIITEPSEIVANDVVVDVNCSGDSTGSITLNPTGGSGGIYTYVWSGPMPGSGISTTGLIAGIYEITVTDSNNCSTIVIDTINQPSALSSIPIGVDISCNGVCDGMMSVIAIGGTTPYNYQWSIIPDPGNVDTVFNICPIPLGNLTSSVTITDSNGCITTQVITINEPLQLDANISGTPIGCSSNCDGTALASPIGGTAPYQFLWNPSSPAADSSGLTGLCIGNYFVTVTDTNNCIDTATYTVTAPPPLNVILDSSNVTCNLDCNGTGTATPSGGTLPYTYLWVGSGLTAADTNATVNNLCPGIYTVTVLDSNNCSFTGSIIITEPLPINDNDTVFDANCGFNDGSISVSPSGGTGPYSHSWNTGNPADTNSILNGLGAGFYTDTITDNNGCIEIFTIGVTNPNGPAGITATVNDALCFGTCTGSLNAIVIGGTGPYLYDWTGPAAGMPYNPDSTLTGLCAGTYDLIVTETSTGCILATSLVVDENDSIIANSIFTNASCNGFCDGTAGVTPTGGTSPYTFLWASNGSTGSSISGLCAGADSVTITDFYGCTKLVVFNISNPNLLTVSSITTNPTCNGDCDGTAAANPSGGTAPYTYQWNDLSSQTGQTATSLCDGTYIVTITDFNGCSVNDTVIIVEPTIISVIPATTNSTCGNSDGSVNVCSPSGGTGTYTYLWTNIPGPVTSCSVSGLPAGVYTVEITDQNLCMQPFVITISDANGPTVNIASTNATCDGICDGTAIVSATGTPNFSYLWVNIPGSPQPTTPSVTGLCAGSYAVQVTDGSGCITTEPLTITDNSSITATVSTTEPTCNGDCDGSVLVVPNGGLPPYSFSWTGGNAAGQTINALGGLCAGNYSVTITDFLGCSFIQNITITQPDILTVSVTGISANCSGSCDGQATATPTGGTTAYSYLWSTGATTPTITALCAGTYSVIITDFKGCNTTGNVIIGDGVAITAAITTVDANCGLCDGSITVTGGGGSGGPYNYQWSPGGQTSTTINNLCPGAYQVAITDNLLCEMQFNILVNNINGPTITTLADSVTCFGFCDGLAYTNVTAGTSPFIFQWDDLGPPGLTTNDTALTLCAGLYNVVVQDSLGCITVDSVTVLEPQELLANLTLTEPSCPGFCDGTATVTPTGGIGSYIISWDGAVGIPVATGGTNTITGLCAGIHTVLITDANSGCAKLDSVTLNDPTPISITLSATNPTCNGDCNGAAIANASGGNPGYQYSWNTSPIQNNSLIGSLCSGQYIVTITDDNGCLAEDSVQVIDPVVLTTISTPTSPSCNGLFDGSITTTPSGGLSPYTYIWSTGDTSQTLASTLSDGTYDVIVIDANNCTVYDTIVLTAPSTINDSTVVNPPTCNVCDGSATSTPTGGNGTYSFIWTNLTAPSYLNNDQNTASSTAVGLCAGTYNLEITDSVSGCIDNFTIIVNNATGPTLVLTATDETCTNMCNGNATVTATGGTTPYSYDWSPVTAPLDTLQTVTDLCVGLYTVTVTDSNICITSDTISVNTNSLVLTLSSVIPETCFGDCDGSATVSVTGGSPAYSYVWSPTTLADTNQTVTGLCVGNYMVTVTDNVNCSDSISTNITGPNTLTVTANINTAISCNGFCDGALIANVLGGTPNYQYSWNTIPVQTTQIVTGLCVGTYIVTITDDNGCTAMDTIILGEPTAIIDNSSLILPACGVCDGSICVAPTGGSGSYSFLWTTPGSPPLSQPNTACIIDLCAANYTLIITDNVSGCQEIFSYNLSNSDAPDPNITVTNITCNGDCDGQIISEPIQVFPAAPYSFLWSTGLPNNIDSITNLCIGFYSVTVTDTNGCIGVSSGNVTEPDKLLANLIATDLNCGGFCDGSIVSTTTGGTAPYQLYAWTSSPTGTYPNDSNLTALCAGDYFVTITDTSGCNVSDSITIIEPTILTTISTHVDASCSISCDGTAITTTSGGTGAYTFQWNGNTNPGQTNSETSLCFGLNTVVITDQNNCSVIDTINIGATDTVLSYAGLDTNYCLGTPVNLNGVPGGTFTDVEWFEFPSMISLDTLDSVVTTPPSDGVFGYLFQVTGACVITDTVFITVNSLPISDAGEGVEIFEENETQLNASGGTTYSWSPGIGLSDSTISNPTTSPTITTTYFVTVTDVNGCISIDSVIITVLPPIQFPDGISPNGDGANDVWIIDFIEKYPENFVEIYNRWGELLFHADGYEQNWDGTYNGKELPIGTYYYIIDLNDETIEPFTGPLTILR